MSVMGAILGFLGGIFAAVFAYASAIGERLSTVITLGIAAFALLLVGLIMADD